ncbi:MAG: phosphatase PAP2 family protein [Candidatus Acidiferrales bacterium]
MPAACVKINQGHFLHGRAGRRAFSRIPPACTRSALLAYFSERRLVAGGPQRFDAILVAGSAAMSGIAVFSVLKRTARRTRPCAIERHCWADHLPPDQFSFPSGHSITAFACAIPLALFYPVFAAWLVFCAVSIAASRVVLGLHLLSDVVVGCILGAALGYWSFVLLI